MLRRIKLGAWDATVFGNDDAADLVGAIADVTDRTQIEAALQQAMQDAIDESGYLDLMYASAGLAAAALVAAWDNLELIAGLGYTPETWPPAAGTAPDDHKRLARQAFARIASADESELAELWIEAGEWDALLADVQRYASALA
jgi:hypothetical protein